MNKDPSSIKRVALGFAAMAAIAVGFMAYDGISMEEMQGAGDGGGRGCHPMEGSTVPYPETGPVGLGSHEIEAGAGALAGEAKAGATGAVTVANEVDNPFAALFLGEDGKPKAKAFIRPGQVASLALAPGSYDVMYETGTDWRSEGFGSCARKGKVKGIVVVEASKASHVVLFGGADFVLANRMDPEVAKRLLESDAARRAVGRPQPADMARTRPERSERP